MESRHVLVDKDSVRRLRRDASDRDTEAPPVQRRQLLSQLVGLGGCGLVASLSGCGTVFYQERIHAPHSRDIDWRIAAADGLGLALFFVPGVVAFVVDFSTGAIYLPPDGSSGYAATDAAETPQGESESVAVDEPGMPLAKWNRVDLPPVELRPSRIEEVVSVQLRRPLSLHESRIRVSELAKLSHFEQQCRRHKRDAQFGMPAGTFFAKLLPC
jgi:hypothetical protein